MLFSLCAYTHKTHGAVEFIVELSKRLLVAQKELGLRYVPEFSIVMVSISTILIQTEFEHEHLSILKLLVFLFKWRTENGMLSFAFVKNVYIVAIGTEICHSSTGACSASKLCGGVIG